MNAELGMGALRDHLFSSIAKETEGWEPIAEKLRKNIDLETALTGINLTESLQNENRPGIQRLLLPKKMRHRETMF